MRQFSTNLSGKVRNFSLPQNRPLIPLYEAIVNSLNAIEERHNAESKFNGGQISIKVIRDRTLFSESDKNTVAGFIVEDNGVGFNDDNMASFMEADSEYKSSVGGKGVGRFSWLKAFSDVSVDSVFYDQNKGHYLQRKFNFSLNNTGIEDEIFIAEDASDNKTVITLHSYLKEYEKNVPTKLETIAIRIIQHCLVYFLNKNCPSIVLSDEDDSLSLNSVYLSNFVTEENTIIFNIEGHGFRLLNIKIQDRSFNNRNRLYLCANGRLVESKDLEKYISDLDEQIFERKSFWYLGVLTSEYFDKNVDMNRLSFNIQNEAVPLIHDPSIDEIVKKACSEIELYLNEYLSLIKAEKEKRVLDYTSVTAPQYRHLLTYMPDEIATLKPGLTDEKLDDALYGLKRKFENKAKAECNGLVDKLFKGEISSIEYQRAFENEIGKISDANRAALADYIVHRKIIITLFESGLAIKEDGKFNLEKYIHDLIYPMRSTSDNTKYDSHNLWLIDETMSYSQFISSDMPFDNSNGEDRADILFLDKPVAVAEGNNDGTDYDAITIFELKRPMRDDYSDSDNPITQLMGYVQKIMNGRTKDCNHRIIHVNSNTRFYLYAICDITPSLERILDQRGFTSTPDSRGRYLYNNVLNSYTEVLSYDKILNDAKKRNRVLFDKLGI